jgi:hypothetical protein
MIPMRYSEARGTLIYEKNLKSKISCQTPFHMLASVRDDFAAKMPESHAATKYLELISNRNTFSIEDL